MRLCLWRCFKSLILGFAGHVTVSFRPGLATAVNVWQFRGEANTTTHLLNFCGPAGGVTYPSKGKAYNKLASSVTGDGRASVTPY